jgi:hypothetical protein
MRNAAATGTAIHTGMLFMRAYTTAARPSNIHPAPKTALKRPSEFGIAVMIALAGFGTIRAAEPPPNLARQVAHRETLTSEERNQYAYTQSVQLQEMNTRGSQTGEYRESREVIFLPGGERTERFVLKPVSHLKDLIMTEEDFADIRSIQPFVLTEDQLRYYATEYKGEEPVDGRDCWVLSIKPRQILAGQRLFEGLLWVAESDFSVIRSEGRAVPQIITGKQENLFPRFATTRKPVGNFWFPVLTVADDTLNFRAGPIREKLVIRYDDYKKFGSDTTITFDH